MKKIYLDQASTSYPKAPSVARAVYDYLSGSAVNVNRGGLSGCLFCGRTNFRDTRTASPTFSFHFRKRQKRDFYSKYHHKPNILLKGLLKPGDHVLVSSMEHNAIMRPLVQLAGNGVTFDRIPCREDGLFL